MAFSLIPGSSIEGKKGFSFSELKTDKFFWLLTATILFLIVVFILLNVYKAILSSSVTNLETEISELDKKRDTELENEIQGKANTLKKIKPLLDSHRKTSKVFGVLEEEILDEITFSDFNFDAGANTLTLNGKADSSYYLIVQDSVFKSSSVVESAEIKGVALSEAGVTFSYIITLKPDILFKDW